MKTTTHVPAAASMERIEELASAINYRAPDWMPYRVAIKGTETSALDAATVDTLDASGLYRQCSRFEYVESGKVPNHDDGQMYDMEWLLDDAAERLDAAHLEWLEAQIKAARRKELAERITETTGIYRKNHPGILPRLIGELLDEAAEVLAGK